MPWLGALACVAAWLAFMRVTSMVYEDALISYRYAENLALGHGFVYNVGERVLGTTSPLYTMLLAALAAVFGVSRIPLISNALALLAGVASVRLLHATLVRAGVGGFAAVAATLVTAIQPAFLWAMGSGLETPLVVCAMVASLHAAGQDRWHRAMAACGLLVLTRIDGVVWAGLMTAMMFASRRSAPWKPLGTAAAVVAPWFVFSWFYFGTLLPQSLLAKLVIHPNAGQVDYAAWFAGALWLNQPLHRVVPALVIWAGFVAVGAAAALRNRRLLPLVAFPVLFMAFLLAGHAPSFPWYMTPAAWSVGVLATLGCVRTIQAVRRMRTPAVRALVFGAVVLGALLVASAMIRRDLRMAEYARLEQANETGLRRRVGEWLSERTPPDAQVAMEAVGYQGTYARRRIIDLAGLISPEVVAIRKRSRSNAQAFDRLLRTLRPDAVVLRTFEVATNHHAHGGPLFEVPAQRDSFFAHYEEAARFAAPYPRIWGDNAFLTVWTRTR